MVVDYEIKTMTPSLELMHRANEQVGKNLNHTYKVDDNSFHVVNNSKLDVATFSNT